MTDKKLFICEEVKQAVQETAMGNIYKITYIPIREYDATETEQLRKRIDELETFIEVRGYEVPR